MPRQDPACLKNGGTGGETGGTPSEKTRADRRKVNNGRISRIYRVEAYIYAKPGVGASSCATDVHSELKSLSSSVRIAVALALAEVDATLASGYS